MCQHINNTMKKRKEIDNRKLNPPGRNIFGDLGIILTTLALGILIIFGIFELFLK